MGFSCFILSNLEPLLFIPLNGARNALAFFVCTIMVAPSLNALQYFFKPNLAFLNMKSDLFQNAFSLFIMGYFNNLYDFWPFPIGNRPLDLSSKWHP